MNEKSRNNVKRYCEVVGITEEDLIERLLLRAVSPYLNKDGEIPKETDKTVFEDEVCYILEDDLLMFDEPYCRVWFPERERIAKIPKSHLLN